MYKYPNQHKAKNNQANHIEIIISGGPNNVSFVEDGSIDKTNFPPLFDGLELVQ